MATKARAKANSVEAVEAMKKDTVTIRLPRAPIGEQNFVIASCNGVVYKIMKGVDVEVPPEIAEILEHSEQAREEADAYLEGLI